jgi:redox-sensitive bicupin YhaK (pirin superfamily)
MEPFLIVLEGKAKDVAGSPVRRYLPVVGRRHVGPFVFFDRFGPVELPPGGGADVGPHPHIGLATVTTLFEGRMVHRDSLGTTQEIRAGELNWMHAGRGIVHSERAHDDDRGRARRSHGLQLWVGLPEAAEESAPTFQHVPRDAVPELEMGGVALRLLAGEAFGERAPVHVASPLFYAEAAGTGRLTLPPELGERGVFVVEGEVASRGAAIHAGALAILQPDDPGALALAPGTRAMLLGGQPLGTRRLLWNFVSSDPARLQRAKDDWIAGRFDPIPHDAGPPIPFPGT